MLVAVVGAMALLLLVWLLLAVATEASNVAHSQVTGTSAGSQAAVEAVAGSAAAPGTEVTHEPWSDIKVWSVEDHTPADWLPADEGFLDMPKPTKAPAKPAVKPLAKPPAKPPAKPADQGRVGSLQKVSQARAATEGTHFSTTPLPATARPPSPSSSSTPMSRKARSPEARAGSRRRLLSLSRHGDGADGGELGRQATARWVRRDSSGATYTASMVSLKSLFAADTAAATTARAVARLKRDLGRQHRANGNGQHANHNRSKQDDNNDDSLKRSAPDHNAVDAVRRDIIGDLQDGEGSGEGSGAGEEEPPPRPPGDREGGPWQWDSTGGDPSPPSRDAGGDFGDSFPDTGRHPGSSGGSWMSPWG